MTIESSKNLGGIGAIMMFIGLIPFGQPFLGIIALVGLILVLISLHGFADYFKERGIFNNSLYGVIAGIVGIVIASIVLVVSVLASLKDFLLKIYPGWNGDWSTLSGLTPNTTNITTSDVLPFIGSIIAVLLILWIFVIIAAFFSRRSLKMLSTKTSVGLMSTGALLLLIGAVLTIFLIGFLLMWIAVLLIAIAFFQIKPPLEQQPSATTATPQPTPV
jgi:uncharacterized membrane protein